MAWPQNRGYLSRIKSAVDSRQRPTAALLEEDDPYSGWSSHDYRLQEAVNVINREICKTCGNPVWICHSTDNRIEFDVRVGTCYADAEIKEYEKRVDNGEAPKLSPGEYLYAIPVGIENDEGEHDPLPTRLEAMLKLG